MLCGEIVGAKYISEDIFLVFIQLKAVMVRLEVESHFWANTKVADGVERVFIESRSHQ